MNQMHPLKNLISRKAFSLEAEIPLILEKIPQAAFIAEAGPGRVLAANTKAVELTAFTRAELNALPTERLFAPADPNAEQNQPFLTPSKYSRSLPLLLTRRGPEKLEVQAEITPLGGQRLLITCQPVHLLVEQQAAAEREQRVWRNLEHLAQAVFQTETDAALAMALQATLELTNASCITIYQVSSQGAELWRTNSCGEVKQLPETIAPYELGNILQPALWTPGKKSSTGLSSYGRRGLFSYLAYVPLGQQNAILGLLLAGGSQATPPKHLLPILKTSATIITHIIETRTLLEQQRRCLQGQSSMLTIKTAILNTMQDGAIILSPDLSILAMNPSAEQALGYGTAEVYGQPYDSVLIGSNSLATFFAYLTSPQEQSTASSSGVVQLIRRNGQPLLVSLTTLPVFGEEGFLGAVVLFRDLSEQEQYRARHQQLEQRALLGEFTASLAHELRNPINNLSTGLQLLAFNLPPENPEQENIRRMQHDCERLAELVKASLSFAKPMEYHLTAVNIGHLLEALLQRWRTRLKQANIQAEVKVEKNPPPVLGDPRALEQVATNLISNAVQAMSEGNGAKGGTLTIRVRPVTGTEAQDQVEISFSDTGPGIPPEIRDHIFESFFTTKEHGTGLGLAIVKRILTAHKGSIHVASVPGGTVFTVRLPIYAGAEG